MGRSCCKCFRRCRGSRRAGQSCSRIRKGGASRQEGAWIMRKGMTATAATIALASMQASAAEVKIDDLIVAKTILDPQRDTELKAAESFHQFWNTRDESLLKAVVSPNFTDHTLPP